jgi:hypothetical protein
VDRFDQARVEIAAGDRPELGRRFAAVEWLDLEPLHAGRAAQLGEERQQRMASVELVGAVGQQEHDGGVAQVAHEEAEQVAGRAIRPVEVLDHEEDGRPRGEPLEDAEEQLEHPALGRLDAQTGPRVVDHGTEIRHEARQLGPARAEDGFDVRGRRPADQTAQGLDDRGIGQGAVSEQDAAALEHLGAGGPGPLPELRHQPRLADPRLAGEERRAALPVHRPAERRLEASELVDATDQDGTGDAGGHAPDYHACLPLDRHRHPSHPRGGFDHDAAATRARRRMRARAGPPRVVRLVTARGLAGRARRSRAASRCRSRIRSRANISFS